MALQRSEEVGELGLTASSCYIRVVSFNGDKDFVNFKVGYWVDQAARDANKQELKTAHYTVPYVDGMNMTSLYNYLKTLPEFSGAVDC